MEHPSRGAAWKATLWREVGSPTSNRDGAEKKFFEQEGVCCFVVSWQLSCTRRRCFLTCWW